MSLGVLYAALAFTAWGVFPLYFKQLGWVPPGELLIHRILWSLLLLAALLTWRARWAWLGTVLRQPKVLGVFVISSLLLSGNWLTYIWAVNHGHVIDASLGYFINPLVNVLLGCTLLHERLRRTQWMALALAAAGVLWLTVQAGSPPWIALVLASSFGVYGLMRKTAPLGAMEGLTLETMLLAPLALAGLGLLLAQGESHFPSADLATNAWLASAGPFTAIPLLLFAAGARRIPLSTLGLLQYIGPSIQFGLGLWVFGEPFSPSRLVGFVMIWSALAIYSAESLWRHRRQRVALAQATTTAAVAR